MKNIILILHFLFLLQLTAQKTLTNAQWKQDLRLLQNTIHKDYSFLFIKTTKETFDTEVDSLYSNIPNLENHEIIVGMARIIALFKYGHMGVGFYQKPFKFHYLPFNLYEFTDGIYLQGVQKGNQKALGAKVLEINKVPIADALKRIYPVVSAENTQYFKGNGINHLTIPEVLHAQGITDELENSIELTLEKDGENFKQVFTSLTENKQVPNKYGYVFQDENWLEAREQKVTPLYLKNIDKFYFFEYLPKKKAVYVRLSQIEDDPTEDIKSFYSRLFDFIDNNEVKKLLLDVRLNGGGNNYKNRFFVTEIIKNQKINNVGSLFVIIGRRTFSACQNLVNELENYTNAIFVGEPTAENINFYGDNRPVILPNSKIPVYLSYAWWQDKPAWENAEWLAPSIPVDISFEEYSTNQDPVLDAALTFSDINFKPNPMRYITDMVLKGEMEKLLQEVTKMIKNPKYDFFDFETELSKAALHLVNTGRVEGVRAGVGILSFVTQLFPTSSNSWKNLGEGYLKAGDNEKAIELLNKAISLDFNGEIAKRAKEILKNIKS